MLRVARRCSVPVVRGRSGEQTIGAISVGSSVMPDIDGGARPWCSGRGVEEPLGAPSLSARSTLTVASLNVHAGMDRHHVPFDVVDACRSLESDVVVLQEAWWPVGGVGHVVEVAAALGYHWRWVPFGTGVLAGPASGRQPARWWRRRREPTVRLERDGPPGAPGVRRHEQRWPALPGQGQLGLAVLSRHAVARSHVVRLPQLRRDRACRFALVVGIQVGDREVQVIGVHLGHLSHGSIAQYLALRRAVDGVGALQLVAGDMNLWGPVVERLLPGWRRTVIGRTWPAHMPVAQPDHILVASGFSVVGSRVCSAVGSDHRPIRVELALT